MTSSGEPVSYSGVHYQNMKDQNKNLVRTSLILTGYSRLQKQKKLLHS